LFVIFSILHIFCSDDDGSWQNGEAVALVPDRRLPLRERTGARPNQAAGI